MEHSPTSPTWHERLYQRAEDGYPVGASALMRESYGPIPDNPYFLHGMQWEVPAQIHGWQWSTTFGQWGAVVRFADGWEGLTWPRKFLPPELIEVPPVDVIDADTLDATAAMAAMAAIAQKHPDYQRWHGKVRDQAAFWRITNHQETGVLRPTETIQVTAPGRPRSGGHWRATISLAEIPEQRWLLATGYDLATGCVSEPLTVGGDPRLSQSGGGDHRRSEPDH